MALLPSNKRDQIAAGISVVAVILVVVYYMYVWDPKKVELTASQLRHFA